MGLTAAELQQLEWELVHVKEQVQTFSQAMFRRVTNMQTVIRAARDRAAAPPAVGNVLGASSVVEDGTTLRYRSDIRDNVEE